MRIRFKKMKKVIFLLFTSLNIHIVSARACSPSVNDDETGEETKEEDDVISEKNMRGCSLFRGFIWPFFVWKNGFMGSEIERICHFIVGEWRRIRAGCHFFQWFFSGFKKFFQIFWSTEKLILIFVSCQKNLFWN